MTWRQLEHQVGARSKWKAPAQGYQRPAFGAENYFFRQCRLINWSARSYCWAILNSVVLINAVTVQMKYCFKWTVWTNQKVRTKEDQHCIAVSPLAPLAIAPTPLSPALLPRA